MLAAVALVVALGGCLGSVGRYVAKINREGSATADLEGSIQSTLDTRFHRHVRAVSCSPYVDEVTIQSTATLTCVIRFADGTSYTTQGAITNPAWEYDMSYYTYTFGDPPGYDVTTAPLPATADHVVATSPRSLLRAGNLAAALRRITGRLGSGQLIIQAAIYPGMLEIALGANGQARLVTVSDTGSLIAGALTSFTGSRSGIAFSQLLPRVIERLTATINHTGGLPLVDIGHFTLVSLPGQNAGWAVYPVSGPDRFRAYVMGDGLEQLAPVRRPL